MNHRKRATVVIGAGFGDEGKGLMTDYHCARQPGAIVVRFNGGAQAGHTVQRHDGTRHVFHHFGAGMFAGAGTFLSRFFIVNPLLWQRETIELSEPGQVPPRLLIDREAPMTTPYDMLINQELESARGASRHGSCGIGINETINRCRHPDLATWVRDIEHPAALRATLLAIRDHVPVRLAADGVGKPSDLAARVLASDAVIENFMGIAGHMRDAAMLTDVAMLAMADAVVFEGAQGLLLDEHHRFYPHVTHSRTGLPNVAAIAGEIGIAELDVTYVTRAYATRHGAGPFPTEDPGMSFPDPTNVPNEFQGDLRFGALDLDLMKQAIDNDATPGFTLNRTLAITCMDQMPDNVRVRLQGVDRVVGRDMLPELVQAAVGIPVGYLSNGPARDDVRLYAPEVAGR
ncbi:MAG: adenylosuccinate synthase [Chlorobi bacterium]|nr:adenylosuccinate synthase [Chlorobiota bacterium]